MTAAAVSVEILREREAKTAQALREIDAHLERLQRAKADREIALGKIRSLIAVAGQPEAGNADED